MYQYDFTVRLSLKGLFMLRFWVVETRYQGLWPELMTDRRKALMCPLSGEKLSYQEKSSPLSEEKLSYQEKSSPNTRKALLSGEKLFYQEQSSPIRRKALSYQKKSSPIR